MLMGMKIGTLQRKLCSWNLGQFLVLSAMTRHGPDDFGKR